MKKLLVGIWNEEAISWYEESRSNKVAHWMDKALFGTANGEGSIVGALNENIFLPNELTSRLSILQVGTINGKWRMMNKQSVNTRDY